MRVVKVLKIVGIMALALWMAWVTWDIEFIKGVAVTTCELANAANKPVRTAKNYPAMCPGVDYVWSAPPKNSN